jgi:hypothetical protein
MLPSQGFIALNPKATLLPSMRKTHRRASAQAALRKCSAGLRVPCPEQLMSAIAWELEAELHACMLTKKGLRGLFASSETVHSPVCSVPVGLHVQSIGLQEMQTINRFIGLPVHLIQ